MLSKYPRRHDLLMTNRHADQRRRRRQLRALLRSLVVLRFPTFGDMS